MRSATPDLVLLDLIMPKLDGISVLREMKKDESLRNIPVIILTNLSTGDKVAEAMQLGTFDFLVKANYSLEDVLRKVKERLA
jgi:CheY-like chemotaxis protein